MIHIIGEGIIEQAQALNDVRDAMIFDQDIYLGAMWAKPLGIKLSGVAVYNMEPLYDDSPLFNIGYLDTLRDCKVIDYSNSNVTYLKTKDIEAFHMPYGFHKSLVRNVTTKKDIDVLFVGSSHFKRRQVLFEKLDEKLNFVIAKGVYGVELDNLIGRAKVHLNVHHKEDQPLETVRLNYLLANKCNVVSEFGSEKEVNDMYVDALLFSDYENLVESCLYAMENIKDGSEHIKSIMHDCTQANSWINKKEMPCLR